MNIREYTEFNEAKYLSEFASLSKNSVGRKTYEEPCEIRTDFQRDRDRIIHCKSFRRLKHKTQVFISPKGDHYRTRLTHTLEVAQISRTVARALGMNEDSPSAIYFLTQRQIMLLSASYSFSSVRTEIWSFRCLCTISDFCSGVHTRFFCPFLTVPTSICILA